MLISKKLVNDLLIGLTATEQMNASTKKIVITLIAIIVLIAGSIAIRSSFSSKSDGHIQVEVLALDGSTIAEKDIEFSEGDQLTDLIQNNFDGVVFDGTMLMNIEGYETPPDWSTFLCVYVDGEMSQVGIPEIEYQDGTKITLRVTEMQQ